MAVFAISFRFGSEGDRDARYKSFVNKVEELAIDYVFDETTSFFIIEVNSTAESLAQTLYTGTDIHTTWDKLVVISLTDKTYATKCKIEYPALLKKLMDKR
ncbi:hypothetical protein [Methylobacterium bullatum]|uniref:Uncharacterized protein n=1 Tax=Methylobacterium bullatum TaxID=570505 RepID=A0A679JJN4_9HYPH|nr:hypothetical protein MBLL_00792 [Methylobacterium bullatum]